ncbi:MAG: MFS transporter [Candidatus Sphingomonas phytovorans]|nr:MFS transporter [Sphingomonas sp.]WEK00808.1 MAG: MFS transporter [Sphingomonas sp.]
MQAGAAAKQRVRSSLAAKARLSRIALANMCCGLLGVQIVWGLQNVNTSRIFQTLGANLDELPILWIAAPITGLLVQPIIGHLSDRTWGPLGRRRPYLLGGALVSAVALVLMPNVQSVWAASVVLWLLTGAINVAMEPFRALVADVVPEDQRTTAFSLQVVFIGTGAVFASAMPWVLSNWFGLASEAPPGVLPPSLRTAFYIGAVGLLASVGLTVATTSEQPPENIAADAASLARPEWASTSGASLVRNGALWVIAAAAIALATAIEGYRRELYLIAGIVGLLGIGQWLTAWSARHGIRPTGLLEIVDDIIHMPDVLRRLAIVQFFTWFGLFAMWIYAVPAIATDSGAGTDPTSAAYNASADWVGVMFAFYNGVAAIGAFALPYLVARIGRREAHAACLFLGASGLLGLALITDPRWLWIPALGIGCAWASILSAPYAMVSSAVPPSRMGVYMGIHNVFLVLPQLVAAALLGWTVDRLLGGEPARALVLAAASIALAATVALTIPDRAGRVRSKG